MISSNLLRQKKGRSRPQNMGAKHPMPNGSEFRVQSSEVQGKALSERETEVVKLAAGGMSNKEISTALAVSVKTVEKHRQRAYDKLGFHSLVELVHYAIANGLVPLKFKPFGQPALQLTGRV